MLCVCIFAGFAVAADPMSDRITVTVHGKGPDVILIPGLASSAAVWDATVAHLQGSYRLHVVQVAGFAGASARANAQGPVLQPVLNAIDAYIKTNKLKAPSVIGHSIGGLMGMMLALQHPEDAGKLMIVDSLPFFGVLMNAENPDDVKPQAAAMRDGIIAETQEQYAQSEPQMIDMLVKSPAGRKTATLWAIASDKSVVARAMYEDTMTDIRSRLKEIKAPVTVLYPFDDSMPFPKDAVDGLYHENFAELPNKTLVRIDGSYHFIMLDQPAAFAAQVDKFLK